MGGGTGGGEAGGGTSGTGGGAATAGGEAGGATAGGATAGGAAGGVSGTGGGVSGTGGGASGNEFPCEVQQVLTACQSCHGVTLSGGAPIALVTRDDLLRPSEIDSSMSVGERSVFRMRINGSGRMPPTTMPAIPTALVDAFDAWVIAGMPASSCGGSGGGSSGTGGGSAGGSTAGGTSGTGGGSAGGSVVGGGSSAGGSATGGGTGFVADAPYTYGAKVKNLLVGLPLTDTELTTLNSRPAQLPTLVDQWMTQPPYQALYQGKMKRFFQLAFQQSQVSGTDFTDMLGRARLPISSSPLLLQNIQESFARTMVNVTAANQPFTRSMTTNTHMMTTALQAFYAVRDVFEIDNGGGVHDAFRAANPTLTITIRSTGGPIPIADSLNPSSPNYMKWYDPNVMAACGADPYVAPATANEIFLMLIGGGRANGCTSQLQGQLTNADFNDWKMVTIRAPRTGETVTRFFDLPTLRNPAQTELLLNRPAVGFFTTPAFFANWQTNSSNQMRVTINQTFIVATGTQVDGSDPFVPSRTPGLDTVHASQAACSYCHRTLDPSRSILAATYSWMYGVQRDTTYSAQKGLFAYRGVEAPITRIEDLGAALASHPLFQTAWPQKLCYWFNSQACDETDPEFIRISNRFRSSTWSWNTLVKELVTSPLTTHTTNTQTAQTMGSAIAVERRDHLCAAWNARLGFQDLCDLDASLVSPLSGTGKRIIPGLPSDGYSRGGTAPVLPNDPTLFYRAGIENLCAAIAPLVVDATTPTPGAKQWTAAQPSAAIAEFVSLVAGLPSADPRAAGLTTQLTTHFNAAKAMSGITAANALRSTFIVACMSPTATSIGL